VKFKTLKEAAIFLTANPRLLPAAELMHCAQSVEYNVQGFPENKGVFFQRTVGSLAAWIFLRKGEMKHDLAAPVPGAPTETAPSQDQALNRLLTAIEKMGAAEKLAPHFAFGSQPKAKADALQALHLAAHVSAHLK